MVEFSQRLHSALGDLDVWDEEFHSGIPYIQMTSEHTCRVLLPVMAFLKDGKDYDDMGLCVYVASDGTFFGETKVGIYIDGKPNPDMRLHVNPKHLDLIA